MAGSFLWRIGAYTDVEIPECPDLAGNDVDQWRDWLQAVWQLDGVVEAIGHASPTLAAQVEAMDTSSTSPVSSRQVKRYRRLTASVLRYVLRARHRPTPFGLFAGVAPGRVSTKSRLLRQCPHRPTAVAESGWLAAVAGELEAIPAVVERVLVTVDNMAMLNNGRLEIPQHDRESVSATASIRFTPAVRIALDAAQRPVPGSVVVDKLAAEYANVSHESLTAFLITLVGAGALVTNLRPGTTAADPTDHLLSVLTKVGADQIPQARPIASAVRRTRDAIDAYNESGGGRQLRTEATQAMTSLSSDRPLAINLRVGWDVAVPDVVKRQANRAMDLLTRLSAHPRGLPGWADYRARFVERYGHDACVPVSDVVSADGLGYPQGYSNTGKGSEFVLETRDARLLSMAQAAALDGQREIVLDDATITWICQQTPPPETLPRGELCLRVESSSQSLLDSGRCRLVVLGVSRNAAAMAGRFAHLADVSGELTQLLDNTARDQPIQYKEDHGQHALAVQLSFPPRNGSSHVARVPRLLDHLICIGEHPPPDSGVIGVDDLAIGGDQDELYLWSLRLGRRIEPVVAHAVNLRLHAPPLARFLAELPHAHRAAVTGFDWGAAASLPFLPRLRFGPIVLAPARWRVHTHSLPRSKTPWPIWREAWAGLTCRRRIPERVELGRGDQRLLLDLSEPSHQALLRSDLDTSGSVTLTEAPTAGDLGWCGGRMHEIVIQLDNRQPTHEDHP